MDSERTEQLERARDEAVRFLTARARTTHEVRRRLRQRGFTVDVAEIAIAALAGQKLLDDAALARDWIEWRLRARPAGSARVADELRRRGVAAQVVAQVLGEFAGRLDSDDTAAGLLRRQRWRYAGLDQTAARRRMLGFLARRGYAPEAAWKAIDQVWEEWQHDEGE
jgi:regulatory protein